MKYLLNIDILNIDILNIDILNNKQNNIKIITDVYPFKILCFKNEQKVAVK